MSSSGSKMESKPKSSSDKLYASASGRGKLVLKGGIDKKKKKQKEGDQPKALSAEELLDQRSKLKGDKFCKAFHAFTQSKDRDSFQTICAQLTPQFASISQRINQCEAELRSSGASALADLVRRIQVLEKTHLESTARIQTWSTKFVVDDADEHNALFVAAVREERTDLLEARESISEILTQFDDLLDAGIDTA